MAKRPITRKQLPSANKAGGFFIAGKALEFLKTFQYLDRDVK